MMWRMEYLNVNLLKSPRDVIAYIVLHELAHLKIE
jgi:predicted metal-dependent hydrolase